MNRMTDMLKPRARGWWSATLVLVVALLATFYVAWCDRELARQAQVIRWQESLNQLVPLLTPALSQPFERLFDQARTALRRERFSETGWQDFLAAAEWQERFPALAEVGYAEYLGDHCRVTFAAARNASPHVPGFDLTSDPAIRDAVEKSAAAGFGHASRSILLGTNHVIIGLQNMLIQDARPAEPAANRANLRGFLFFALDQPAFFNSLRPQFKHMPVDLQLLRKEDPEPARSDTRRVIHLVANTGEWRFLVARAAAPASSVFGPWGVLVGGVVLSLLLSRLVASQTRLRLAAEQAREEVLVREAEITRFNHELEQKIRERTAELHQALAQERELNRLKSNFVAMVNHEIRTPLALILGSAEILSRYLDRLNPMDRADHLQTITQSVDRMTGLLEDVLLFSKAEAGRIEFHPEPMDLREFCTGLVDEMRSATHRRCLLELTIEEVSPARADKVLLRHILSNLIANAVKYSPAGGTVQIMVRQAAGDAIFTVSDHGVGIPEADQKRLFNPFFRGKNVGTLPGTGLGLVIVKHCTLHHGGELQLESQEGRGTTVTIRLPLYSPAHTEFIQRIAREPTAHE